MTPDDPTPTNLLADLESRQDELLRLLSELEERTKQALASLTAQTKPGTIATADPSSTAPSIVASTVVDQSGSEPSMRAADSAAEKAGRAPARSRSRKAA